MLSSVLFTRSETIRRHPTAAIAIGIRDRAILELVYGTGIHVCPGRPLATLELVVAAKTLLDMTVRVELAADAKLVRETYPLGGWRRVPVRLR